MHRFLSKRTRPTARDYHAVISDGRLTETARDYHSVIFRSDWCTHDRHGLGNHAVIITDPSE